MSAVRATVQLDHDDKAAITAVLMGRKVVEVEGNKLTLDNGVQLFAAGNEGCGGCSNGEYNLTSLSRVDNVITSVEFEYSHEAEEPGYFRIFVFAGAERINLMEFEGSDGNGWYGTGFVLLVRGLADVRESTKASTVGPVEEVVGAAVSPLPPAAPAAVVCGRCDGCGLIAGGSDDGEPWTAWLALPPESQMAVRLGLVFPIPCPSCLGTGGVDR